jgi:hypothetical protein
MDIRWIMRRLEQLGIYDAYSTIIGSRWIVRWMNDRKNTGRMRTELEAWQQCLEAFQNQGVRP